jgi:hypothetical protein
MAKQPFRLFALRLLSAEHFPPMHPYVPHLSPAECWLTNYDIVFGRTSYRLQNPSVEPESVNSDCALFCGIQSFTGCAWMLADLYPSILHVPEEANF